MLRLRSRRTRTRGEPWASSSSGPSARSPRPPPDSRRPASTSRPRCSPGNGTMAEALLGSISGALVRRADRPVLVAKHRAVRAQRAAW